MATVTNLVVCDLLHQQQLNEAHFPELVDLAVIATGLGVLQSNLSFVNNKGSYWDSTQWEVAPRPFLDLPSVAYANAIAAWARDEAAPAWAADLPAEVKSPMKKSLKYLHKTNDSFFQPKPKQLDASDQSQERWWQTAGKGTPSSQIIALRQLKLDAPLTDEQQNLLIDKFRSNDRAIVLHTIDATDQMREPCSPIVEELRLLLEHRDDEVRAKACWTLTKLAQLDDLSIRLASQMLESKTRFVVYSSINALASLDSVPSQFTPAVDRGFLRSLQNCDFEFIGLFVAAYQRWHEDPKAHFESLLAEDSPDYLELALEALENVRQQLVSLG